jgi:hypothetical protein
VKDGGVNSSNTGINQGYSVNILGTEYCASVTTLGIVGGQFSLNPFKKAFGPTEARYPMPQEAVNFRVNIAIKTTFF